MISNTFVISPEHAAGYSAPYLSVYSENAVDVFDVNTMEWIQTVPLKKVNVTPFDLMILMNLNHNRRTNCLSIASVASGFFKNKARGGIKNAAAQHF